MASVDTYLVINSEKFSTKICYDFRSSLSALAKDAEVDAAILSTEDGFSPLGASRRFFQDDLGISEDGIRRLADWNFSGNDLVTLIALKSQRSESLLRGAILAPGSHTRSYAPFKRNGGRPSKDFYYGVSFEAIKYACLTWGSRKLSFSHLTAAGVYHQDIATCHVEALIHFCEKFPNAAPASLTFVGCCIDVDHLQGIRRLVEGGSFTSHRPICVAEDASDDATLIHINFQN